MSCVSPLSSAQRSSSPEPTPATTALTSDASSGIHKNHGHRHHPASGNAHAATTPAPASGTAGNALNVQV